MRTTSSRPSTRSNRPRRSVRLPVWRRWWWAVAGAGLALATAATTAAATAPGAGAGTRPAPPAMGGYRGGGPVGIDGRALTLDGRPHVFLGVNAYEAGTDWGVDRGCGAMLSDAELDAMFASLPSGALVRVWAFQGTMGTSVATGKLDWAGLDRVMVAAEAHHDEVVLTLGDQGGTCDSGIWQDPAWYRGGYRDVQDPTGTTPLSYWAYLHQTVAHFRSYRALAMWEPMSEAQASTCPSGTVTDGYCAGGEECLDEGDAALALRSFYDTVGAEIQRLDPRHPVESGLLGDANQCGTEGTDWQYVSESPGIDVLSYHDYYAAGRPFGGDATDGIRRRLAEARVVGKPVIAGEMGVEAGTGTTTCPSPATRAGDLAAKIRAQTAAGTAGVLVWDYVPDADPTGTCSYDVPPGDPTLADLG
jgi:mannan endo-1,4-beta-mannosidase